MKCQYCEQDAELVDGEKMYPHVPRLAGKKFWRCVPCNAHVGCHPGTENPLGRIANAELRRAKMAAHAAFDQIWNSGEVKRRDAYRWLADQLGMKKKLCHIGWFDVNTCKRVVELCKSREMGHG